MLKFLTSLYGVVWVVGLGLGGLLWPYSVNSWLVWTDKDPSMEFWHGVLISLIPPLGGLSVPAAGVTFILSFFLGS